MFDKNSSKLKSLVYSLAIQEKNAVRRVATQTAEGDGKEEEEEEEEKAEIRIFLFLSVSLSRWYNKAVSTSQ